MEKLIKRRRTKIKNYKLLICVLFLFLGGFIYSVTAAKSDSQSSIQETRITLEKWLETQRIISKEKSDFAVAREILHKRVELLEHEIKSLQDKIIDAEESIADADKRRAEMIEENEKLKNSSDALTVTLVVLEDRVKRILERLPAPIRERVKPLSQRLPDDTTENRLSTAERFQNIVGILNEVDKFNREIHITSEVMTLEDGSSVEVAALYIGISQGYYASSNGEVAGIGTASTDGWQWQQSNSAASQIAETIAILKNEKVASFVLLPVKIE